MSDRAKRFDALYSGNADPWSFETSDYERRKYAATLRALPQEHYGQALEIGCSIGIFTNQLARRCEALIAIDVSAVALTQAIASGTRSNVTFVHAEVPAHWPEGPFDLIVFSEVLYFLNTSEVETCATFSAQSLTAGGDIVLVNWLGPNDCALSGDVAAEIFTVTAGDHQMTHRCVRRDPLYRVDLISRNEV